MLAGHGGFILVENLLCDGLRSVKVSDHSPGSSLLELRVKRECKKSETFSRC